MIDIYGAIEPEKQKLLVRDLARLKHTEPSTFHSLVDLFENALIEQDKKNRTLDGNNLYRGLGASIALEDIAELFTNCLEIHNNFEQPPK